MWRQSRFHRILGLMFVTVTVIAVGQSVGSGQIRARMTSECSDDTLQASRASVLLDSSGRVTFACDLDPLVPAFSVRRGPIGVRPHLVNFVGPYVSLWIFEADEDAKRACRERDDAIQIRDGRRTTIEPGDWNYCAEFRNVGSEGLPTFQVRWDERSLPSDLLLDSPGPQGGPLRFS